MFDLATEGAAQLLSKAYLRFYKVEGLRDILTNDLAAKGFLKQMDYIRMFQGIEGMTIGDSSDDFQTMQYTFTGIPEVMLQEFVSRSLVQSAYLLCASSVNLLRVSTPLVKAICARTTTTSSMIRTAI